ncbi:hypothetical protein [Nocardioides sp.]|uniref:hypothetical protein n=1 Tax=Nocardioides sp. TaxID=35761 RepID=UPI003566B23F
MVRTVGSSARGNLSLAISVLALVVALSGTAYAALGPGSVSTKQLAKHAVTKAKIRNGAVSARKLAAGSVRSSKLAPNSVDARAIRDRSIRLRDLGGPVTDRTTTVDSQITVAAGACRQIFLALFNPTPDGYLGSMVVGTITTSTGDPVVSNVGFVVPTLLTGTTQGGAIANLGVCGGTSSQTIPAGSVVTWSLIAP